MQRVLIFGNSGSGKSTLAARLRDEQGLAHLDLDGLAWLPTTPPERRPLAESGQAVSEFVAAHDSWVIEGCYTDLLELAAPLATEAIFLNLPVALCQANTRSVMTCCPCVRTAGSSRRFRGASGSWRKIRIACPAQSALLVVTPKPQYLHHPFLFNNLVYEAVLDVDSARVGTGEVTNQLFESRGSAVGILCKQIQ